MKNILFLSMCMLSGMSLCATADAVRTYEMHCDNAARYRKQWHAMRSELAPRFDRETAAIPVLYFDVYCEGLIDEIPQKYAKFGGNVEMVRISLINAIPLWFSREAREGYIFIIDSFLQVYSNGAGCGPVEEKSLK